MTLLTTRPPRRLSAVLAVGFLALVVAGLAVFGTGGASMPQTVTNATPSILSGSVRLTTFEQARNAVVALYRSHPSVSRASFNDVEYTTAARDKVLRVCHSGGPEKSAAALESARVLACAPLIFFFYSYGRHAAVPQAVAAARALYWYALTANRTPVDTGPGLTRLLISWGVS